MKRSPLVTRHAVSRPRVRMLRYASKLAAPQPTPYTGFPVSLQSTPVSDTRTLQRRVLAATSISYIVVILDTSIVNVALGSIADALTTSTGAAKVFNGSSTPPHAPSFASLLLTGSTPRRPVGREERLFRRPCRVHAGLRARCRAWPCRADRRCPRYKGSVHRCWCPVRSCSSAAPTRDPGERARAIGLWAACGGAAMAGGPLIGGILIHAFGWRSIFLGSEPAIGLISCGCNICGLQVLTMPAVLTLHRRSALDLAGQATAVLALGVLIAVLIEGHSFGWQLAVDFEQDHADAACGTNASSQSNQSGRNRCCHCRYSAT